MIFRSSLPAALNRARRAQSKRDLKASDTAAAAPACVPAIVPGFGALSGIVKTSGSKIGGLPGMGLDGVMVEEVGNSM